MTGLSNLLLYRRLGQQARPYWCQFLGILLLSLLSPPLALLAPLPLKIAVDNVIHSHPLPRFLDAWLPEALKQSPQSVLLFAVLLLVGVTVATELCDLSSQWLAAYTGEKLLRNFRAQLFRHVQRLSLSYHDTKGIADSVYRIQSDATSAQRILVESVVPSISSALTLAAMAYVTFRSNWQLALVAMSVSPAIYLLSRAYRKRLRHQSREVKKIESSALSVIQEVLGAARVVKAFGQEAREDERFARKSNEGMGARLKLVLAERSFGLFVALLTALGTAAVLFVGIRNVLFSAMTLGDLLLVIGYVAKLNTPLKTIGKKMASMQSNLAGAERAFALLDEARDVVERPNARPLARALGAMAFRNVSFAYDRERSVLRDISFEIEAGTCLGIAGTTGAGKTTLVSLLTRFYDPTAGEILLDGVDLRDYRLADLRNQFAIVLQKAVLFSTSIAENIAYARPGAGITDIVEAAKAANAHEFIVNLPEGYETKVGARGMRLSVGERQRIALARAFLNDAPIVILDEPASSVDVGTESGIVQAVAALLAGGTTFTSSHRLSTLDICDMRIEIDDGRIIRPPATFEYDGVRSVDPEGRLIGEGNTFPAKNMLPAS